MLLTAYTAYGPSGNWKLPSSEGCTSTFFTFCVSLLYCDILDFDLLCSCGNFLLNKLLDKLGKFFRVVILDRVVKRYTDACER